MLFIIKTEMDYKF